MKILFLMGAVGMAIIQISSQTIGISNAIGERLGSEVLEEKYVSKKVSAFNKIQQDFPGSDTGITAALYDQARYSIAMGMADQQNTAKVKELIAQMSSPGYKHAANTGAAVRLAEAGKPEDAEGMLKSALDTLAYLKRTGHGDNPDFIGV